MRGIREALAGLNDTTHLAQLSDATKGMREMLERMNTAARLAQLNDPMKGIRESLERMKAINLDGILGHISKQGWPMAYEAAATEIAISGDNTITIDATVLSCDEIRSVANEIADKVFGKVENLEEAVGEVVAAIQALRNPPLQKILTWFVFPLIVGLLLAIVKPFTDFYIEEHLAPNRRQIQKIQKHVIDSVGGGQHLDAFRLVSTAVLNVRSKPSNKAAILGKLRFGQVVVLVEKHKSWSLVAWSDDENGLQLQGWVFSRYLEKIR
jgi:hypothetical protein